MSPMFSIIMVSLNPGDKLFETLESVRKQSCTDYEIVIKDGGSKDGSMEKLQRYLQECGKEISETQNCVPDETGERAETLVPDKMFANRIRLVQTPDKSIYDGMNQAVEHAKGAYYYFLNCGDSFYEDTVLEQLKQAIIAEGAADSIFYGDQYDMLQQTVVASNPHIDAFACYRNVPCHQVCIYSGKLFEERGYKPEYKVRGDYEHFLWCFFEKKVQPVYVPVVIANYEGGGFSETPENRKRSAKEHKEITSLYMRKGQRCYYKFLLLITLAPLRTMMAHNPVLSGVYNKCKSVLYKKK